MKLHISAMLLVIAFLVIVTGCDTLSPRASTVDKSFMSGKPCAAPCWYGLRLGESTEQDLKATLAQLEFVDQTSIREGYATLASNELATRIDFGCIQPREKECGNADFLHGKLHALRMTVGYELTFKEAVQKLGPPDYISHWLYHPEVSGCVITLYWPNQQIYLRNYSDTDLACQKLDSGIGVDPGTNVSGIVYTVSDGFAPGLAAGKPYSAWSGFSEP
jgi:hypothetical protein